MPLPTERPDDDFVEFIELLLSQREEGPPQNEAVADLAEFANEANQETAQPPLDASEFHPERRDERRPDVVKFETRLYDRIDQLAAQRAQLAAAKSSVAPSEVEKEQLLLATEKAVCRKLTEICNSHGVSIEAEIVAEASEAVR